MWKCPICSGQGKKNHKCLNCGFDERKDFVKYRTVSNVPITDCRERTRSADKRNHEENSESEKEILRKRMDATRMEPLTHTTWRKETDRRLEDKKQFSVWQRIGIYCATVIVCGMVLLSSVKNNRKEQEEHVSLVKETEQKVENVQQYVNALRIDQSAENAQDFQDEQVEPQQIVSENEALWQNVYEQLIDALSQSEYDFSNLTFDSYTAFLLKQGFLFDEGSDTYINEVVEWGVTGNYYAVSPDIIQKREDENGFYRSQVVVNPMGYNNTSKLNDVSFDWNSDSCTEDFKKACPLIMDYEKMADNGSDALSGFLKAWGISDEMMEECKASKYESAYMDVWGFDDSIWFEFKNGELGQCSKLVVEIDTYDASVSMDFRY